MKISTATCLLLLYSGCQAGRMDSSNLEIEDKGEGKEDGKSGANEIQEIRDEMKKMKKVIDSLNEKVEDLIKVSVLRSCAEYSRYGLQGSGLYMIDPDGKGQGQEPFQVYCNFASETTELMHFEEEGGPIQIDENCDGPGCYHKNISYINNLTSEPISVNQISSLIEISEHCEQAFRFDCKLFPLSRNGVNYSWWQGRDEEVHTYLTGKHEGCDCDLKNPSSRYPDCNSGKGFFYGNITDMSALPMMKMYFGGFGDEKGVAFHFSKLKCYGEKHVEIATSCSSLKKKGVMTSGYYHIKSPGSKQVKLVFCDMKSGTYMNVPQKNIEMEDTFDNEITVLFQQVTQNKKFISNNTFNISINKHQIDSNIGKIDDNAGQINRNADKIDINAGKIDINAGKINNNTGNINSNSVKIKSNYGGLNSKIDSNTVKIINSINSNTGKIDRNAAKINNNTGKINSNYGDINGKIDSNTVKIINSINSNTGKINRNTAKINSNTGKINSNYGDINGKIDSNTVKIINSINSNTGKIDRNAAKINSNTGKINSNYGDINEKIDSNKVKLINSINSNTGKIDRNMVKINSNTDKIHDSSPLGTIIAWVPRPETSLTPEVLPDGWLPCDGTTITKGPWAGGKTPDLNSIGAFLRGSSVEKTLEMEEDQMQDHLHDDSGHSHSCSASSSSSPHYHSYSRAQHSNDDGKICGNDGSPKCADSDKFDYKSNNTVSSTVSVTTTCSTGGHSSGIRGVQSSYRRGAETRPRNMKVNYVIRCW